MKYNAALSSTADTPDWEIEDLTEIQHVGGATWSNRWLGVVIAIAVAIVGFGFVGHWSTGVQTPRARALEPAHDPGAVDGGEPSTSSDSQAPFELTSPAAGTRLEGGLVEVHGIAARPLGSVHMAIWLGDVVLGWTNVDVPSAGPVTASIRVFAPPFTAPVELRIDSGTTGSGEGLATVVAFRLHAASSVGLWRTRVEPAPAGTTVRVEGFGSVSTEDLEITVRAADDRVLATSTPSIGQEDGRPGSFGGGLLGLGSFTAKITLAGPLPSGRLTLFLTWRDRPGDDPREISVVLRESSKPGALP